MKKKKPVPPKTDNLTKLADEGVAFAKRDKKTGEFQPVKTKKQATHKIEETPNSVVAAPVKKWPKPPKAPDAAYGPPRISDEVATSSEPIQRLTVPVMPNGSTHLEYATSTTAIVAPVNMLSDFMHFRGTIRFGRLRYGDTFVSMMPGEEGQKGSGEKEVVIKEAPKPPKAPAPAQSSPSAPAKPASSGKIARPAAGSKTGRIWELADLHKEKGAVLAAAGKEGINSGTANTQFSAWRRFKTQEGAK